MLIDINMEFVQAFNPLYAVPIVAVILCAFIVYAFGFKSPVQPPSFDGIEEEKKITKKKRSKDNQKNNKLLQNGKVNGSAIGKLNISSKKKDVAEKSVQVEKTNVAEKKATKKSRIQNEKKTSQDRKKENFAHDDLNDDGWVQLVSKKVRKNRKRDDASTGDNQSNAAVSSKSVETSKSDNSFPAEESPKKNAEFGFKITSDDKKQPASAPGKENFAKDASLLPIVEKPKLQDRMEVAKPDLISVEKQHSKEVTSKGPKILEESSKSKKKKKQIAETVPLNNESTNKKADTSAVQMISDASTPKDITNVKPTVIADILQINTEKSDEILPTEVKSSNVAFDELAGLYPENKEQKKKKKVRRDH